jgi:hypothetical protein
MYVSASKLYEMCTYAYPYCCFFLEKRKRTVPQYIKKKR